MTLSGKRLTAGLLASAGLALAPLATGHAAEGPELAPQPQRATAAAAGGDVTLSTEQLRINQRISQAAIRRAAAVEAHMEGDPPPAFPAPGAGPGARFTLSVAQLRINQSIAQAAVRRANALRARANGRPPTRAPDAEPGAGEEAGFTLSATQLLINQRISQAALRRVNALIGRLDVALPELTAPEPVPHDGPGLSPPTRGHIAEGVSIGGVPVGGLTRREARDLVLRELVAPAREPITVRFGRREIEIHPARAGYVAEVDYALAGAMNFGRSQPLRVVDVPLRERVDGGRIRTILRWYESRFGREPRDAALGFRGAQPVVREAVSGLALRMDEATRTVARAIIHREQESHRLPTRRVDPQRTSVGFVVVVERADFELRLYHGEDLRRTMPVAVGMPTHPTPAGRFRVIDLQVNPTWYPPDSRWAEGLGPVAPGAGNPLGTRWIGISAPAIGIHGTPSPETLGSRASHGCIRMRIPHAEWLYSFVDIGTTVKIV